MAHSFLTLRHIGYEILSLLENELIVLGEVNRDYDNRFAVEGAKINDTARVRFHSRFVVSKGTQLQKQPYQEKYKDIKVGDRNHIGLSMTNMELTLQMDDFSNRVLVPQVSEVAQYLDGRMSEHLFQATPYYVGTPGTDVDEVLPFLLAGEQMNHNAVPRMGRCLLIGPGIEAHAVDVMKTLFNPQGTISSQFRNAEIGSAFGWRWKMTQNVRNHTIGDLRARSNAGNFQMREALASEDGTDPIMGTSTFKMDQFHDDAEVKKGDVFTVAGVHHVNPRSRQRSGYLQKFVVEEDADANNNGQIDIKAWPQVIMPASATIGPEGALTEHGGGSSDAVSDEEKRKFQYQTVDGLPANNAVVTFWGTKAGSGTTNHPYRNMTVQQGLGLVRDYGNFVSVDLERPGGNTYFARVHDAEAGLALMLVEGFEINTMENVMRLDWLTGNNSLRREMGVRILSGGTQ